MREESVERIAIERKRTCGRFRELQEQRITSLELSGEAGDACSLTTILPEGYLVRSVKGGPFFYIGKNPRGEDTHSCQTHGSGTRILCVSMPQHRRRVDKTGRHWTVRHSRNAGNYPGLTARNGIPGFS
jgi:hypothetical protein